jgi:uncharacterized LabA/DUF88 family protein
MRMEERLKIAVFVDFDNIEIGVKTTLGAAFDIGTILEAIKERGEVVTKIAYGDWTRAGDYSRLLTQHAIKMVQRNLTPGGDKNGADINLALDALEMALTHDHINAYVIVGGDSDFLSLVEKLKQYDKTVLVVGGRAFTSVILQRNCHEFIAYENLINVGQARRQADRGRQGQSQSSSATAISHAFPLVRRALKVLSEREVTPQLGLLKSTLLQLDSTFSEKNYGASSFRDFAEKLAQAGLLRLNQAGRNLLVEIKETETEEPVEAPAAPAPPAAEEAAPRPSAEPQPASQPVSMAAGEALAAQQAEAIAMMRRVLENAPTTLRWPMYVRNIKQLMRAAEAGFDERRYGFGGILDLLRGGQRDGLLRLERDRQGVLRVFPGTALQRPATPAAATVVEAAQAPEVLPDEPQAPVTQEPTAVVEVVPAEAATPGEAEATVDAEVPVVDVEVEPGTADRQPAQSPARRGRGRRGGGGARKTTTGTRKAKTATPAAKPRARKPRAPKSEE